MKNIKLHKIIESKLLDIELNYSAGTLSFYKSHTNHFLKWCELYDINYVNEFKEKELIKYISYMKKNASNSTINKRIGILKRVYLHSQINFDFLFNIKKLKENNNRFEMIDNNKLSEIIAYIKSLPEDKLIYKVLILLLIDTGARINEILKIEKKNINLKENEILLTTTKTKSDRIVFFINDTKENIIKLVNKKIDNKYLLFNELRNRPMNYDDVRYIMRKIKEDLNIKKLHPHMFRHTHATILIENGADLISVMKILGHNNIKTTERYLHMSKKHVKKNFTEAFKR